MPWMVSADTKGFGFTRWDQNTLAMGIQTEKPCSTASTDLQGLLHELGSLELCTDSLHPQHSPKGGGTGRAFGTHTTVLPSAQRLLSCFST